MKQQKWCVAEAEQRVLEIQRFLELSVKRSSCERDPNKDRLFVYMKGNDTMPLSAFTIGNCFHCSLSAKRLTSHFNYV
jgi:gamma-tubulin complex component 6